MAKVETSRVGDYQPDQINWGPTIEEAGIQDKDVVLEAIEFVERSFGTICVITLHEPVTLEDGTETNVVHCSGSVIAQQLGQVTKFPVVANFTRVQSKKNPRFSYWSVS